jgi:hypothetical protein
MKITLKHIYNTLEAFTTSHGYLNSFHKKNELSNDLEYPLMWAQTDQLDLRSGELSFTIIVMILDRLNDDSEELQILSETAMCMEDLITILNDNIDQFSFNVDTTATAKPIIDYQGDKVAGWRMPLKCKIQSTLNELKVPMLLSTLLTVDNSTITTDNSNITADSTNV